MSPPSPDPDAKRWNHNIHYQRLLLDAIPKTKGLALDVGCGEGILTRALAARTGRAIGLDLHEPSLDLARAQSSHMCTYVRADVLAAPFTAGSFSAVVSVATLHHIDAALGLTRMADLLEVGGVLGVVGLARSRIADLPHDALGAVATRVIGRRHGGHWEHSAPIVWPPPDTYRKVRRIVTRVLPGAVFRRHVLFRYSVVWTKR